MATKKTYLLDTDILLHFPYAINAFDEHDVVITDTTLGALSNKADHAVEYGSTATDAIRIIENLRRKGNLITGVSMGENKGNFRVVSMTAPNGSVSMLGRYEYTSTDKVLFVCKNLDCDPKPILVTNNTLTLVKAELMGIAAEDFRADRVNAEDMRYTGRKVLYCSKNDMDAFYRDGHMSLEAAYDESATVGTKGYRLSMQINEFCVLRAYDGSSSALGRFDGKHIVKLVYEGKTPYNVKPKNVGQVFALEALLSDVNTAPLVILKGAAGTAKTFLALAAGLSGTLENAQYRKILVCRPNVKFDSDIGFLKGTEEDKIGPLMRPVMDNLELLTASSGKRNEPTNYAEDLFAHGTVVAQALAYMRGRSIADTYIIIDEAQNMTPTQAFGIISRVGAGTKVVLLGDPAQIDAPYLDSRNNGLCFAAERMKGNPLCWQMTFEKDECVRSPLALAAIKAMNPKGHESIHL